MEKHFITYPQTLHLLATSAAILTTAILLLLTSLFLIVVVTRKNKNMWPPSPPTLPLLGNFHQLIKAGTLLSAVTEMAKSYGPLMTVWMGLSPMVVLTGQKAIWEALVNQASNFASRSPSYTTQFASAAQRTTITSPYNEHWNKLRKALHNNVLSPFHLASKGSSHHRSMNHLINKLMKEMKENEGVVRPLHALKMMAISFIAPLCFGPDFHDESFMKRVDDLIAQHMRLNGRGQTVLLDLFPFTRYFIPSSARAQKEWKAMESGVLELLLPLIQVGRSYGGYLKRTAPKCFLNCLLSIGEGEEEEDKLKLSDEAIAFNLFELFLLGVDSTATAIEWALAYLINHPHIQKRAYEEVKEAAVERKGVLLLEDLGKVAYVGAVVKETLRKEAIAPLAVPHRTVSECKVMGINIPANATVIFNLHSVSNDPGVWSNPEAFVPERFLSGDSDIERWSYLPFGAGRRICAGMDVASVYVPISLANLLTKFEWMCVKEGNPPDLTPDCPSLLKCMKYPLEARIQCRGEI